MRRWKAARKAETSGTGKNRQTEFNLESFDLIVEDEFTARWTHLGISLTPRPLPRREGSKETHPGPTDPPQPSLLREGEKDGGKFGGNEINLYLCNE